MEHTLAIFTPTYNRADCLINFYQCLVAQTSKDFIWLVVDDGSTDSTKETIHKLQAENIIDIHYIWHENQGKPNATNLAAEACTTELFMTVDDDDRLVPDAVETIVHLWQLTHNFIPLNEILVIKDYLPGGLIDKRYAE